MATKKTLCPNCNKWVEYDTNQYIVYAHCSRCGSYARRGKKHGNHAWLWHWKICPTLRATDAEDSAAFQAVSNAETFKRMYEPGAVILATCWPRGEMTRGQWIIKMLPMDNVPSNRFIVYNDLAKPRDRPSSRFVRGSQDLFVAG